METKISTKHNSGTATIFKNPFLESLTRTSLKQNIIVYGLVIILLVYNALFVKNIPIYTFLGLFILALFFWTFSEYILHRYLFHWINENKYVQRFHFIMHGSHHLYPRDMERLLMPPVPGLIMASILFGVFYLIFSLLGIPMYTWAFFLAFSLDICCIQYCTEQLIYKNRLNDSNIFGGTIASITINIQIKHLAFLIHSGTECSIQCPLKNKSNEKHHSNWRRYHG